MGEDKRARANRIGNSLDAPNADDTYWLVSEAIGAWNRVDGLEAEVARLRADAAALAEVTFSLRYAIGQWTEHGPPEDFDALAWVENMRDMIEDVRQRALRS